jgi:hypothetical protein
MFAGSSRRSPCSGAPDLIVLTLSEFAAQAYRINRAGGLPLMVDADHGYGNALNVKRTVEELETAGIAGMSIEDTELPTPFGTQQAAADLDRRGRRQDEGGAGRPTGSRCCRSPAAPAPCRSAGSTTHRARQGLRVGRRRCAVLRRRADARRARRALARRPPCR